MFKMFQTGGKTDLASVSNDELFDELRKRGFTVTVAGQMIGLSVDSSGAAVGLSTEQKVFEVLEAMEKWSKQDRHRHDKERAFVSGGYWCSHYSFDWARQPPGHCCDADKSIHVGLSEYRSHEDPESSQVVVIKHQDTERPGNYAQKKGRDAAPPVWGIAFSCAELKVY